MKVADPTGSSRSVGQRLRFAAPDLGIIIACWAFVAFLSTAQRWTWLNTPDAEFYASLGLFGHDVTDRTVTPVYYWTRLGTIAPVRLLTKLLGPWTGYHVFWLLLIAVIITAVYLMLRRFTTRLVAALMALLTCLSTVILAFLGNPYVTGTAMAAMFVIIASTVWTVPREGDPAGTHEARAARYVAPVLVGMAFGWVAMTNPNATFISAAVWVVATAIITVQRRGDRRAYLLRSFLIVGAAAAATFLALLAAGRVIFPGLDWLETYLFWSKALNLSAYVSDAWVFTRDVSIIVPLTILVTVLVVLALRPRDRVLEVAAALSPTAFGLTVLLLLITPSGTLEVGHYQSLQWPPALAGLSLAVAATVGRRRTTAWMVLAAAAAVLLTIVAGHRVGTMALSTGWVLAIVLAILFLGAVAWTARAGDDVTRGGRAAVVLIVCTAVLMAGFQLMQNARRPTGVMAEGLYSNAYNPNDTEARLTSARDAQAWLIDQTSPSDTIMVWVDADWASGEQTLLSMAAFQIWGANQVTPARTLDQTGLDNARAARASVLALYGKSMQPIIDFWSSIPREVGHSDLECSEYPWPDPAVPIAHVCLTRLTWP